MALLLCRMKLKNEELYADSAELMKMRSYLDEKPVPQTEVRISEMEFAKLDEILLGNILKAVEDNLSEAEFDVQHLAEKVNMSRSTLTRKLKAITGLTPLEYIRRVKMQHACRMLKDPHTTLNLETSTFSPFSSTRTPSDILVLGITCVKSHESDK